MIACGLFGINAVLDVVWHGLPALLLGGVVFVRMVWRR